MQTAKSQINSVGNWTDNLPERSIPKSFDDFIFNVLSKLNQNKCVTNIVIDRENKEYGALSFEYNDRKCLFRQAKSTPKKMGQFVTIWKRESVGSAIVPFDDTDDIDLVIIATDDSNNQGYFIFDKETLTNKHIFTVGDKQGKRAIRVYAPWVQPEAKQAINTRKWQIDAFVSFPIVDVDCLSDLKKMFC